MHRLLLSIALVAIIGSLAGCGHMGCTHTDGICDCVYRDHCAVTAPWAYAPVAPVGGLQPTAMPVVESSYRPIDMSVEQDTEIAPRIVDVEN